MPNEQTDTAEAALRASEAHSANQIPNSGGAPRPAGFNIEDFKRFADLGAQKKKLEAELRKIKGEMSDMEEPLLEQLIETGMPQVKLDSGALISQRTSVTVKAGPAGESATEDDWNRACDVLEAIGMAEFSKRRFLQPTLKSYITTLRDEAEAEGREYDELAELLPPELAEALTVGTVTQLTVKGA